MHIGNSSLLCLLHARLIQVLTTLHQLFEKWLIHFLLKKHFYKFMFLNEIYFFFPNLNENIDDMKDYITYSNYTKENYEQGRIPWHFLFYQR